MDYRSITISSLEFSNLPKDCDWSSPPMSESERRQLGELLEKLQNKAILLREYCSYLNNHLRALGHLRPRLNNNHPLDLRVLVLKTSLYAARRYLNILMHNMLILGHYLGAPPRLPLVSPLMWQAWTQDRNQIDQEVTSLHHLFNIQGRE